MANRTTGDAPPQAGYTLQMADFFPPCTTQSIDSVCRADEALRPGVDAICRILDLKDTLIARFPDGSLPVYALGDTKVLKIYPPPVVEELATESGVLSAVQGHLPIPTPTVHAVGELEGWGYLLMERLEGESLVSVWGMLKDNERLQLASDLGQALKTLHSIEGPPEICLDWADFVDQQRHTAVDRQRQCGLDESWLRQIPPFLAETQLGNRAPNSLLHTEVMAQHLLTRKGRLGWSFSGIFDFEPAMVGAPEYEFAAVGLFFSCGERDVFRAVLLAYGYSEEELGSELANRFLAYTIIHRYSNLPWFLSLLPPGHTMTKLEDLADHWWGT